jgi:hypothetical protein
MMQYFYHLNYINAIYKTVCERYPLTAEGNDRDAWGSRMGNNYDGEGIASTPLSGRKPRSLSRPAYPRPGGLSLGNISS